MKALIALASSSRQLSGVPRHAINLAQSLLTRPEITELHLVAAPWQQEFVQDASPRNDSRLHFHAASIGNRALSRNWWFYAHLPRLAAELDADLVHLAYPVPVQSGAFHCPTVVTLHDLYPHDSPENFGFPKVLFNRAVLRQCLRGVDAVACVSQVTFSRLKAFEPELAQKATVVYNSVEKKTRTIEEIAPPKWDAPPFLLCVAQHRRNKNILLAIRVFEHLLRANQIRSGTRLVIVGINGPETSAIKKLVSISGLAHRVVLLNGISDTQLQWCYRNCSLLLAPSTTEGFGLPIAEALLAGCRVVCSDIPAFRELGGSHCYYFPLGPQEMESFADAIRTALRQAPPAPIALPQLSPPIIAEQYMRLYGALLTARDAHASSSKTLIPSTAERQHLK